MELLMELFGKNMTLFLKLWPLLVNSETLHIRMVRIVATLLRCKALDMENEGSLS